MCFPSLCQRGSVRQAHDSYSLPQHTYTHTCAHTHTLSLSISHQVKHIPTHIHTLRLDKTTHTPRTQLSAQLPPEYSLLDFALHSVTFFSHRDGTHFTVLVSTQFYYLSLLLCLTFTSTQIANAYAKFLCRTAACLRTCLTAEIQSK